MSNPAGRLAAALADRYRIERPLGQGGMATVYLAADLKHDRQVAIKVLKPELAAVLGAERFVQEIRTTAALSHPHILPLFDSGEAGGFLYYVMPYIEGETIREKLNRETQFGIDDAVRITTEVADALDYAHRHGVIHRDIKPENILLHDGRPMVADFGIALAVSAAAGGRMTETGLSLGTPHYMSPEQATAEKEITARSDVYSLASVLYEMLAGQPPHLGGSAQQIIMKIIAEPVAVVTALRKSVPPNVAAALTKALEKLPADRFDSAKAFAEALGNPHYTTAAVADAGAAAPASVRAFGWWMRSPWTWGVSGLAVAALAWAVVASVWAPRSGAVTYTQWTGSSAAIMNARFTRDRDALIFSSLGDSGTTPHLYTLHAPGAEPQPIGPDSTHLLAISSTGALAVLTHARYLGHRIFAGTLATLSLNGEAPREVATDVREADWSPDGKDLAIIHRVDQEDRLEYPAGHVLARSTGYLSDMRASPAGDRIGYVEHEILGDDRGAVVLADRSGRVIARSPVYWAVEGVAWDVRRNALLFSAVQGRGYGDLTIFQLGRNGQIRKVLSSAGGLTLNDVSPTGRLLITTDLQPALAYGRAPGASGPSHWGAGDTQSGAVLSPDGKLFAYSDVGITGGSNYTVVVKKANDPRVVRLGDGFPLGIAPDDRYVLAFTPTAPPRLMLYPVGPGEGRRLDHGEFSSFGYQSPGSALLSDGRRFFVCGSEAGHGQRCYLGDLGSETLTPVTPEGTTRAIISPDGRRILALVGDSARIYSTDGGTFRPALGIRLDDGWIRWSPDSREAWVQRAGSATAVVRLDRIDPETGARSSLGEIVPPTRSGMRSVGSLALADDPRVYAFSSLTYTSTLFTADGVR
jgi:tRNA A-37 threonylcarbamoyl transferase component Bud32